MTTVTPVRFFLTTQLTTTAVQQYVAPANTTAIIKRLVASNITAGAVNVFVFLTPSGGSNQYVTDGASVAATTAIVLNEWANMVLAPGDAIWASASANTAINLVASGFTFV